MSEGAVSEGAPTGAGLPLGHAQRLIHTGQALAGPSPIYNMIWRFDIDGAIDPGRFEAALHAALLDLDAASARIVPTADGPMQLLGAAEVQPLPVLDLGAHPAPDAEAARIIQARGVAPIDLSLRSLDTALIRLADDRWIWALTLHHVFADAASVPILYHRVAAHYLALGGTGNSLPPPRRFAECVIAESAPAMQPAPAADHWRERIEAPCPSLQLYGRATDPVSTSTQRVIAPFGPERSARLIALSEQPGLRALSRPMSIFQLFGTCLAAFLSRISDSPQVRFGAPAHNRASLAARETCGLFIELFPLEIDLRLDETFRSLHAKVAAEAQAFLRNAMPGASSPALAKRFNVVFNYIQARFAPFAGIPTRIEWGHAGCGDPGHDLRFQLHDFRGEGEFSLAFDASTAIFPPRILERLPHHFLALFDAMLADFDRSVAEVEILSSEESAGLAALATGNVSPQPLSILERFAAHAKASPDAIAARMHGDARTYRDLDAASDALARAMVERGAGPGVRVGVHLRRSFELLVGLLATMKSGAAFVPLEAELPRERLAQIVQDADLRFALAAADLAPSLAALGTPVLDVADWPTRDADDAPPFGQTAEAGRLAYVLYTSGSTGRPKGVAVPEAGLARYIDWAIRTYADGRPARYALYSSIGFDLTLTSIFGPLASGGTIEIYPEASEGDGLAVLDVFARDEVDIVKLTPAHLALLCEQRRTLRSIRTLILGGEDLKTETARRAMGALGDVVIWNEYGPTEAIVGCMSHRFDPETDTGLSVPIGRAGDDCIIRLLNHALKPAPQGTPGELYIGGARLADGYWGSPELTAERFIADPYETPYSGDGRLYRSGDLARMDEAGRLIYLGRRDDQVKIRGVRIELSEVEAALASVPGVTDAAVRVLPARSQRPTAAIRHCTRCGLGSDHPDAAIGADGVCSICLDLESYRSRAEVYFRPYPEFESIVRAAAGAKTGAYDALMLLSGGKDSSYALYRLAEIAPNILAMTLDNGYIADGAKENIRRITQALGVKHVFMTAPEMDAIFADSLARHANVCNGCFKTIYTLGLNLAKAEGIPIVVTGLSRGQFFETRLTADLFLQASPTAEDIDAIVLQARRAYHQIDDAVTRSIPSEDIARGDLLDRVRFVDFYRYCDVSVSEIYRFLGERAPWVRPKDTGRSTNCLINDVGIYVHKQRTGYHNYALPYSWDVRMGHKTVAAAAEELDDRIDPVRVHTILDRIGYKPPPPPRREAELAAYYTAKEDIDPAVLRAHVRRFLTEPMTPSHFVRLASMPLTANGKIDRASLPDPASGEQRFEHPYRPPRTQTERVLARLWRQVLPHARIGIADNFYEIGGDSIAAIQIAARARSEGLAVEPIDIFQKQTIEELAALIAARAPLDETRPRPPAAAAASAASRLSRLDAGVRAKLSGLLKDRPDGG